jgi:hypothetical protein
VANANSAIAISMVPSPRRLPSDTFVSAFNKGDVKTALGDCAGLNRPLLMNSTVRMAGRYGMF